MSDSYYCVTCQIGFDSKSEMIEHVVNAHGIDVKKQSFEKTMISHLDSETWYSTTYQWSCDKVTFIQTVASGREKNDPMRGR